jgi:hypothetical protein
MKPKPWWWPWPLVCGLVFVAYCVVVLAYRMRQP